MYPDSSLINSDVFTHKTSTHCCVLRSVVRCAVLCAVVKLCAAQCCVLQVLRCAVPCATQILRLALLATRKRLCVRSSSLTSTDLISPLPRRSSAACPDAPRINAETYHQVEAYAEQPFVTAYRRPPPPRQAPLGSKP